MSMKDVAATAPNLMVALNEQLAAKMAEMAAELACSRKRARLA
jgi:hypothetical protein